MTVIRRSVPSQEPPRSRPPLRSGDRARQAHAPTAGCASGVKRRVDGRDVIVHAPDLSDEEVELFGRDPFLIAYALADPAGRIVVTTEVSKPTLQRAKRRIPDVCRDLGVHCCAPFAFIEALDFATGWRR